MVFSLVGLVPINNRIAKWTATTLPANWQAQERRWDSYHWFRDGGIGGGVFHSYSECDDALTANQEEVWKWIRRRFIRSWRDAGMELCRALRGMGPPQGALVGIAVTPQLEIVFDTVNTSRKLWKSDRTAPPVHLWWGGAGSGLCSVRALPASLVEKT